jgi:hypothetical protein
VDAAYLQGPDAPSQLIFSLAAIDGRYSVFDTPHTFRAILDNYEFVSRTTDGRFALLERRVQSRTRAPTLLLQEQANLNARISIPRMPRASLFMKVEISPRLIGRVLDILYKPTNLYVQLRLRDGHTEMIRFTRATAVNGLFVSKYVRDLDDLRKVFVETYAPDIVSARIIGNPWIYSNDFKVSFYEAPFAP